MRPRRTAPGAGTFPLARRQEKRPHPSFAGAKPELRGTTLLQRICVLACSVSGAPGRILSPAHSGGGIPFLPYACLAAGNMLSWERHEGKFSFIVHAPLYPDGRKCASRNPFFVCIRCTLCPSPFKRAAQITFRAAHWNHLILPGEQFGICWTLPSYAHRNPNSSKRSDFWVPIRCCRKYRSCFWECAAFSGPNSRT